MSHLVHHTYLFVHQLGVYERGCANRDDAGDKIADTAVSTSQQDDAALQSARTTSVLGLAAVVLASPYDVPQWVSGQCAVRLSAIR